MICLYLSLTFVLAQTERGPSAAVSSRPAATPADLAEPYIDGNEEYSIRPPRGWRLSRQRIPDNRGIQILRLFGPPVGIQDQDILLRREFVRPPQAIEDRLKNIAAALGLEFSDVRLGSQQVQQIAGRPGGVLTATYSHDGLRWVRVQALVEWGVDEYLSLVYSGPVESSHEAESLVQWMLASLRFLPRCMNDAELKQAVEGGKTWQASLKDVDLRKKMIARQFLRVEQEGRTLGFIALEESEFVLNRVPGLRLAERGWVFDTDGRIRSIDHAIFLAHDSSEERWRNEITTWSPPAGDRPAMLEKTVEEAARVKDTLISSQSYVYGQPAVSNPPLKLPASYLPRLLTRWLPRCVDDLARPRRMAFTTFDHARADLVVRVVEFKGPAPASLEINSGGKTYLIEEREGLAAEPSRLFADATGRIVLIKAGKLRMTSADEQDLEKLLGPRIADADRKISDLERDYEKQLKRFARPDAAP